MQVCLIEPGNYIAGTNIFTAETVGAMGQKLWNTMSEEVQKDYGRKYFNSKV